MTDSIERVWVAPSDPHDLAPLPALVDGESRFAYYDRKEKQFGKPTLSLDVAYQTFEECRAAMIEARTAAFNEARAHAGSLVRSIEHIRNIPTQEFPANVLPEVPEAEQQEPEEEKAEGQKEVKPALKRPSRKS